MKFINEKYFFHLLPRAVYRNSTSYTLLPLIVHEIQVEGEYSNRIFLIFFRNRDKGSESPQTHTQRRLNTMQLCHNGGALGMGTSSQFREWPLVTVMTMKPRVTPCDSIVSITLSYHQVSQHMNS